MCTKRVVYESHICSNMLAMSFSLVRVRSFEGLRLLKRLGVGVRDVSMDEIEQSDSEVGGDCASMMGEVEGS